MLSRFAKSLRKNSGNGALAEEPSHALLVKYIKMFSIKLYSEILKRGPIPKHLAIIMDGNRRYSKKMHMATVTGSYGEGAKNFFVAIIMALELNIGELSVFSYSEGNLKRASDEVNVTMQMAKERFETILEKIADFNDAGIRWDVVGNWNKIPSSDVRTLFAKTCVCTQNNKTLIVRLLFAYSSREEICEAITEHVDRLIDSSIRLSDVSENLVQESFTNMCSFPVDIVIRTGGDSRVSDFMLWQTSCAHLSIWDVPWPEFTIFNFLNTILYYQERLLCQQQIKNTMNWFRGGCKINTVHLEESDLLEYNRRKINFLENLRHNRLSRIKFFAGENIVYTMHPH